MTEKILVLGYGPVGHAVTAALRLEGTSVRVAQRSRPADLPTGTPFTACDVLEPASVLAALQGITQIVVTIGFAYDGKVWAKAWPLAMQNLLAACKTTGARLVFIDNLYMYGAQTNPLTEAMPLTDIGRKTAARSAVTRLWQASDIRVAALRAPDSYGPGVTLSHLGDMAFGALGRGKAATMIVPADTPHDFAYVPDMARAVLLLLAAPDSDFGQAWHMPSAPIQTPRQILALGAAAIDARLRITALPLALAPLLGVFMPMMRELHEMRFQWDRPYRVDASRFTARFGFVPTPFAVGAAATARAFVDAPTADLFAAAVDR